MKENVSVFKNPSGSCKDDAALDDGPIPSKHTCPTFPLLRMRVDRNYFVGLPDRITFSRKPILNCVLSIILIKYSFHPFATC